MNGENSNGILTQSQKNNEGRSIDDLTVREAKSLGYEILTPEESKYLDILSEFAHENIENTFFENKSSKSGIPGVKG